VKLFGHSHAYDHRVAHSFSVLHGRWFLAPYQQL
jgi:hypothetical protein